MATKRIRIQGKTYRSRSLDDVTLDDLIVFDVEAEEAGWPGVTFDEVEAWADRLGDDHTPDCPDGCTEHQPLTRRQGLILSAVTVWLIRRGAGEDITLKQAAKTPISQIEQLPDTEDRKPGPTSARKGGKKHKAHPKASGPADTRPEPAEPQPAT